jgi:hypothetical protein
MQMPTHTFSIGSNTSVCVPKSAKTVDRGTYPATTFRIDEECVIASLNYLPILSLTSSSHCVSDMTELVHLHELFISPGRLALGLRYVLMSTTEHTSITMHLQVAMYLQSTMHFQFHGHLGYARCLMRIVMRQFYSTFTLRPSTRMNPTSDTNFVSPSL